jgi:hypothetical protein
MSSFSFLLVILLILGCLQEVLPLQTKATARKACTSQSNCLPNTIANKTGVPTSLVSCDMNTFTCVCKECFQLKDSKCYDQPCWTYNSGTHTCVDTRKSQLTAFLLSFFLSYVGAANFYIERHDFAGAQLALFLLGFCFVCVSVIPCCILPCCAAGSEDSDKALACGTCCYVVFITLGSILITLASLAISAWWIADLVIFVENTRLDGRGCHLSPTLTGPKTH